MDSSHIISGVAIVGLVGTTLWLNRKISKLEERLQKLEKALATAGAASSNGTVDIEALTTSIHKVNNWSQENFDKIQETFAKQNSHISQISGLQQTVNTLGQQVAELRNLASAILRQPPPPRAPEPTHENFHPSTQHVSFAPSVPAPPTPAPDAGPTQALQPPQTFAAPPNTDASGPMDPALQDLMEFGGESA